MYTFNQIYYTQINIDLKTMKILEKQEQHSHLYTKMIKKRIKILFFTQRKQNCTENSSESEIKN